MIDLATFDITIFDRPPHKYWDMVVIPDDPDACWGWNGILSHGYGKIPFGETAHRIILRLIEVPIPTNKRVDHLCSNKVCSNPRHLELVSFSENDLRGNLPHFELRGVEVMEIGMTVREEILASIRRKKYLESIGWG